MNDNQDPFNNDSVKELTRSLFLINGIHQQLEEEREHITTAVGQMTYVSKKFENCSQHITEKMDKFDNLIHGSVTKEMRNIGKAIAEEASRSFVEISTSQTETSLKKLMDMTNDCEYRLNHASEKINYLSRWFITSCVVAALIGGALGGGVIRYLPANLDQRTKEKIHAGEMLEAAWRVLDQKEKEKIFVAANLKSK